MMIHLEHTAFALPAMMRSRRFVILTHSTIASLFSQSLDFDHFFIRFVYRWYLDAQRKRRFPKKPSRAYPAFWHRPRIRVDAFVVIDKDQDDQYVATERQKTRQTRRQTDMSEETNKGSKRLSKKEAE